MIFIHVVSVPVTEFEKGTAEWTAVFVPWRLSAFVVQGFIFLSGMKMFLNTGRKIEYKKYYLSRFKKIVVPYIFCVCIFYAYFCRHEYFGFSSRGLAVYILSGSLVSHFYFVIVIVQFYFLRPVWQKMLNNVSAGIAVAAATAVTLYALFFQQTVVSYIIKKDFIFNDRIFTTYIIYWVLGCYAGANYEKFLTAIKNIKPIAMEFFAVAVLEMVLSYIHFSGMKSIGFLELVHVVYCVSAIAFFGAVSLKIGERIMKIKLFAGVDRLSYYIYLIHPLLIIAADDKMNQSGVSSSAIALVLRTVVAYIGSFVLCMIYQQLKSKKMFKYFLKKY